MKKSAKMKLGAKKVAFFGMNEPHREFLADIERVLARKEERRGTHVMLASSARTLARSAAFEASPLKN